MQNNYLKYKEVHVEEIPKIVEIRDAFNNLWFKIILKNDPIYEMYPEPHYQIKVIAFRVSENPLVIVDRPEEIEKTDMRFQVYSEALKIHQEYVRNYTALVKAQTRDVQDIDIYAEKIGYKKPERMCCATCQFCRARRLLDESMNQDLPRLECWNAENQQEFNFDINDSSRPIIPGYEYHHFIDQPSICPPHHEVLDLHPTVDPLGVCDHWVKRTEESTLYPGQSLADYIDQRVGTRINTKISAITETVISTELTSELSIPVIQAVTMVLSSPDASVTLSAPVVNLVTNSQEIQANTVNVINNAISTDAMAESMYTAVSGTFQNPSISDILETPIANVVHTTKVSSAIVNVVEDAISTDVMVNSVTNALENVLTTPETSAQIDGPLAGMIYAPETSAATVSAAQDGIKITEIRGGKEYKDADGDGNPDEDSTQTTIIFGGLGA